MSCGAMTPAGIRMYDISIFGTRGALLKDVVPTLGRVDKPLKLVEVHTLITEDILLHIVAPALGNAGILTLVKPTLMKPTLGVDEMCCWPTLVMLPTLHTVDNFGKILCWSTIQALTHGIVEKCEKDFVALH